MEAIILAGGLGTRLRQTVPDLPKPMAPVNGRPFLEHQIRYWAGQGVRRFVISVGYKHHVIQQYFGERYHGTSIAYAIEEAPLGTGGGLLLAVTELHSPGPWLVLNGDTFFDVILADLSAFHTLKSADLTLSLFPVTDNPRYTGVEMDGEHRIKALSAQCGSQQLINGGVYILSPSALSGCRFRAGDKASFEREILSEALKSQKLVYGFVSTGTFVDIGIPEDYARAAELLP
jgi:D-glycero-alpha-D-manno-heptose 1-phosphate guanylyltransferase